MRARMGGLRGLGVISEALLSEALLSETLPSETLTPEAESLNQIHVPPQSWKPVPCALATFQLSPRPST